MSRYIQFFLNILYHIITNFTNLTIIIILNRRFDIIYGISYLNYQTNSSNWMASETIQHP